MNTMNTHTIVHLMLIIISLFCNGIQIQLNAQGTREKEIVIPQKIPPEKIIEKEIREQATEVLIVATTLDFDNSVLKNKQGIEVLNTLTFDIQYIQIKVQVGMDLQWLITNEKVLHITKDVEKVLYKNQ